MMEPTQAIPLHFSLEFLGVAALGSLLAWAVSAKRWAVAVAAFVLFALQIAHAGELIVSESPARVLAWALAGACVLAAVAPGRRDDLPLWAGAWALLTGSRASLAALNPHSGLDLTGAEFGLHALASAGAAALGTWVWRRTVTSVRLRIIGAFVLVLFLVITLGGGAVVRVVAQRIQDEELARVEVDVRAQRTLFRAAGDDILSRGALVAQTLGTILVRGGDVSQASKDILDKVFTDLSFIAVFGRDRRLVGGTGLQDTETDALAASAAVSTALGGQSAPSLERVPGALVALGANPVFRPGPAIADNIVAAVVLGRRFDAGALATIARERNLSVALVSTTDGSVIAAGGTAIVAARVPPDALQSVRGLEVWSGPLSSGGRNFFGALAPLERADATVPGALLFAAPDTVLARTTLGVTRALFAGVLAATLLAVIVALWLGSRIARPILELTAVARRVEEGDLEAEPEATSEDEIGTLARAFGSMTTSLRSTIAAERATRQRLSTIVGGMGEALVAVDDDFNIVSFNPAAEAVTGVAEAEALGRKCYEVYGHLTAGRDGKPICDYVCPLRHGGGRDRAVELRRGRSNLAVAVTTSTLRDEQGDAIGGVDLLRDVTAEVQAEQTKSNFLANVGHELRTPLTPIKGYAQILRRQRHPRAQELEYIGEIVDNSVRLERIVSILVDVAEMESGRFMLAPVAVEPGQVVRDAAARWKDQSERHDVRAVVAKGLRKVVADPRALRRVLDELLDNAVKFSPEGGRIDVRARPVAGGVELSITDRGIGIPRDQRKTLFDAFVQADASSTRRFGGLGVGLYFVRRVVEGHNSSLAVSSRPGRGSTFSFVLPPAEPEQAARAAKRPSAKRQSAKRQSVKRQSVKRAPAKRAPAGTSTARAEQARTRRGAS